MPYNYAVKGPLQINTNIPIPVANHGGRGMGEGTFSKLVTNLGIDKLDIGGQVYITGDVLKEIGVLDADGKEVRKGSISQFKARFYNYFKAKKIEVTIRNVGNDRGFGIWALKHSR